MALNQSQNMHTALVSVQAPYSAVSQWAQQVLIQEESLNIQRMGGVSELVLILQESSDPNTPFVAQTAQEVLVQESTPLPVPSLMGQLTQMALIEDLADRPKISGVASATIISQEAASADPIFLHQIAELILLEELKGTGFSQVSETVLISTEPAPYGTTLGQNVQVCLVETEAPLLGSIVTQSVEAALISTQGPLNDIRLIGTHHLALCVDISGITTTSSVVSNNQVALLQEIGGEPVRNPERNLQQFMPTALAAGMKYPQIVQSTSSVSFVSTQAALAKTLPLIVQSISRVFGSVEKVARQSANFVDPSNIASNSEVSHIISTVSVQVTKPQPSTIHSMSILKGIAHQMVLPVQKLNPVGISSTEQVPTVIMQTPMLKQYGPINVTSESEQAGSIMTVAVGKGFAQHVQSMSIAKKTSRLVSRVAHYQSLDMIRSLNMIPIVSRSIGIKSTYQNPDDIRPILSLIGAIETYARPAIYTFPEVVASPTSMQAISQSWVVGKVLTPPTEISGTLLNMYNMVELVAHRSTYVDPEVVEIVRREMYGTYYSELDNN